MGNMPLYREITMFEKILNKRIINHKVACTCFCLTCKINNKSMQSTKNLFPSLCCFLTVWDEYTSLQVKYLLTHRGYLSASSPAFCSHTPTYSPFLKPVVLPSLVSVFYTSIHFFFILTKIQKNLETQNCFSSLITECYILTQQSPVYNSHITALQLKEKVIYQIN